MRRALAMFLSILVCTSAAWAQVTPEKLQQVAENVSSLVRRNASSLSDSERQEVLLKFREIRRLLNGRNIPDQPSNPGEIPGSTVLNSISRKGGGETYTLNLTVPVRLSRLEIRSTGDRIRVYSASLLTLRGERIPVQAFASGQDLYRDQIAGSEVLSLGEPVRAIELRAEAWASNLDLQVTAYSLERAPVFGGISQPTASNASYCTAACLDSNGKPDALFSAGAQAVFEAQARQAAVDAVRSQYSCRFGIDVMGCSPVYSGQSYYCLASCSGNDGLLYAKGGAGNSLEEARANARANVRSSYSCRIGITDHECSDERRPSYCTAACTTSEGAADLQYSKGAEGPSKGEASANAIEAVRSSYSCRFGIAISNCASH